MKKLGLFLALVLMIFSQLACGIPVAVSALGEADCESKGGKWRHEADSNGRLEEWCEMPSKQQPTAQQPAATKRSEPGDCFAPQKTYNWLYEDLRSSSGTGGLTCNGRFLFKNKSADPQILIIYTAWDNNKLKDSGWDSHPVPPGGVWEKKVSRTFYKSGVITFDRVERLLIIWDAPECTNLVPSASQATEWEARAEYLDEIPCP